MNESQETGPIREVASTELSTRWGAFRALGFERQSRGQHSPETAIVLVLGDPSNGVPLVRIHSQCFTGDVLRSLRCDCGEQLELAMRAIAAEGCGLMIYEQQEGRGIGLMAKLQAYALQGISVCLARSSIILESREFACFRTILTSDAR
jgi:GTP cyclohydrolase II